MTSPYVHEISIVEWIGYLFQFFIIYLFFIRGRVPRLRYQNIVSYSPGKS